MGGTLVSLPMYDWPEIKASTDLFYQALRGSLEQSGFGVPDRLDRSIDVADLWLDKRLLLAQTCGLPFVTLLKGRVALVGTPAYELNCDAGDYYSVIVVRNEAPIVSLADLAGRRFSYNETGSQSGYAALKTTLLGVKELRGDVFETHKSGSHRLSIQAVAAGIADFAAIDAVTWEIAQRHEPAAQQLRVLAKTDPTPGLPFITALRPKEEIDRIAGAVEAAIASLDEMVKADLFLKGFKKTTIGQYEGIESRMRNNGNHYLFKNEI